MVSEPTGPRVTPTSNGPYRVDGWVPVHRADATPAGETTEQVYLCRCGGSSNKPYCDGTRDSYEKEVEVLGSRIPLRGLKKTLAGRNDDQDGQEGWFTTEIGVLLEITEIDRHRKPRLRCRRLR